MIGGGGGGVRRMDMVYCGFGISWWLSRLVFVVFGWCWCYEAAPAGIAIGRCGTSRSREEREETGWQQQRQQRTLSVLLSYPTQSYPTLTYPFIGSVRSASSTLQEGCFVGFDVGYSLCCGGGGVRIWRRLGVMRWEVCLFRFSLFPVTLGTVIRMSSFHLTFPRKR